MSFSRPFPSPDHSLGEMIPMIRIINHKKSSRFLTNLRGDRDPNIFFLIRFFHRPIPVAGRVTFRIPSVGRCWRVSHETHFPRVRETFTICRFRVHWLCPCPLYLEVTSAPLFVCDLRPAMGRRCRDFGLDFSARLVLQWAGRECVVNKDQQVVRVIKVES